MPSTYSFVARILLVIACLTTLLVAPSVAISHDVSSGTNPVNNQRAATCAPSVNVPDTSPTESGNLSLDMLVAPSKDYDQLSNARALAAARETGSLTPATVGVDLTWEDQLVAYRDVIVHQVSLDGSATALLARLAAQDRGSPTANFRTLIARGDLEFDYIGASACPPTLALNATIDRGALRVVPDRRNDTLFLVFDTDRLLFYPPGGDEPTTDTYVRGHHGFSLTLRESSGLTQRNETVRTSYHVENAEAEFTAHHRRLVQVEPTAHQTIRGWTTLAPGSEITVALHPYTATTDVITATATVNRSRVFTARFDLSNASPGVLYVAEVREVTEHPSVEGGAPLATVGNATGAVINVSDQTSMGTILYQTVLITTDGGFVTIQNASGDRIGVSEYFKPGAVSPQPEISTPLIENQSITVTVYRDVNGNQVFDDADVPYRLDGTIVQDTASIRLHEDRNTIRDSTPTARPYPSPTPSGASTSGSTKEGSSTQSSGRPAPSITPGMPGFGVRPAIVAFVLVVLVRAAFQ